MLRVPAEEIATRILADQDSAELQAAIDALTADQLATAIRDLGGHDLGLLTGTFDRVDEHRPTVVFAYTVKGRGLATEGHPSNHSVRCSPRTSCAPWPRVPASHSTIGGRRSSPAPRRQPVSRLAPRRCVAPRSPPARRCRCRARSGPAPQACSTQAVPGDLLADPSRDAPEAAARLVTCSADGRLLDQSGGWINKTGVWSVKERHDWFADDAERAGRAGRSARPGSTSSSVSPR